MSGLPESGQGWEIYELVRESGSLPARSRKPTAKCRDPPPPPQARPPPRARAACLLPRRLHRAHDGRARLHDSADGRACSRGGRHCDDRVRRRGLAQDRGCAGADYRGGTQSARDI
jgi:hypothetical protein